MDHVPSHPKRRKSSRPTQIDELDNILGISEFIQPIGSEDYKSPYQWLETELIGKAEVKKDKVHQNICSYVGGNPELIGKAEGIKDNTDQRIRFYLGGGQVVKSIEEAVNFVPDE